MSIDLHQLTVYGAALAAMFCTTFLRGWQNKVVAGGHKRLAFVGGGLMTLLEGVVVLMLARSGSDVIPFTVFGSACGWVAGMYAHDAMMRKRLKAAKKAKKTKRRDQIEEMVNEQVEERLRELGVI